jgi:hypothetical protein
VLLQQKGHAAEGIRSILLEDMVLSGLTEAAVPFEPALYCRGRRVGKVHGSRELTSQ